MIKDTTYAAQFDKNDMATIYKLAEKIKTTHDQTLVDDFNLKCQKKVDDHLSRLEVGNQKIEFLQVSKADDLVVTVGISQCLDQIIGTSVTRWQYMARGTGTTTPAAGNTALAAESGTRVDMSIAGWREYASSSLRFAGIHGELTPTITINEAGVFTALSAGSMLNRNVFSNFPLSHIANFDGYVLSSIVEFVPVM
jgi:hypothetical protein